MSVYSMNIINLRDVMIFSIDSQKIKLNLIYVFETSLEFQV